MDIRKTAAAGMSRVFRIQISPRSRLRLLHASLNLEDRPPTIKSLLNSRAVEISGVVHGQASHRIRSVCGSGKVIQHSQRAAGDLKHTARTGGTTLRSGAVKIAGGVQN